MQQVRALIKRLASYRKSTWGLEDYPVRIKKQKGEVSKVPARWDPVICSAQIVNWWHMSGHGSTEAEALASLRDALERFRATHPEMPRPGTGAPVEFASAEIVDKYSDLARDLVERVLGQNYADCFISDESSLWDFNPGETNDEYYRKIALLYGCDVTDVAGARLSGILLRIAQHRGVA